MDVLSDAQWRTNTPGLPVWSAQGRALGRLSLQESVRGGCNTALLHSLASSPPGFVVPHHWRRDPRAFSPARSVFRGHNCAFFHGFCALGNDADSSIGRVCAAAKTTERRTYAWMGAARARPRLLSPLSLWIPPPALGKDTGAPGSAAVSSGHLPPRGSHDQARFGRSPPNPQPPLLQFDAERLTVPRPDNKMKPYGAPKVKRRGESHAGAPLLKRQQPDIRASGRLAGIE